MSFRFELIFICLCISSFVMGQSTGDSILSVEMEGIEFRVPRVYTDGAISLSRTEFNTMAGALEDPTRLLIKHPGISTTNDQANSVVYHGLPSQYHKWALYNGRILNPNHLGNAGTISDLPSRTSGGVNMLSGQVIGSLDFQGQPSSTSFDALSSSSNIKLRDIYQNGISTNLSLIGLEAGIDRLFDDGQSGLMMNYRYSTVGMLTSLGLDFGGESINYQDLSAKYSIKRKNQDINMYLSLGDNYNRKDSIHIDSVATEIKDRQNIQFNSKTILAGIHFQKKKGNKVYFTSTLNLSHRDTDRKAIYRSEEVSNYLNTETMVSLYQNYIKPTYGLNEVVKHSIGYTINAYTHTSNLEYEVATNPNNQLVNLAYQGTSIHIIPTVDLGYRLPYDWDLKINLGFNGVYEDDFVFNPIGNITALYNQNDLRGKISISRAAQYHESELRLYNPENLVINSTNVDAQVEFKGVGASVFYHKLDNVPFANDGIGFSAIDQLDYLPISEVESQITLNEDGAADIYGLSIFGYKRLANWKLTGNITLMQSEYKGAEESIMPLDYGYLFNISVARQWRIKNSKLIGVSASFHQRGGAHQNQVDIDNSLSWGYTNYSDTNAYSTRLADYYRADLRIYYKPSARSTISLDIQNVTNRENDGYNYYEPLSGQQSLKTQLGLIPILSWRVNW